MHLRRLLVLPVAGLLVGISAMPLAVAQSSGQVVHRQSVLTEVDATGTPGASRIFTQLRVPEGESVWLPGQATSGLRRLSGSDPVVEGDALQFGSGASRAVADNTADLPVSIEIRYSIDGSTVDPDDVVGHDGEVAVTYIVRNLTAEPTELTLIDGDGEPVTQTVDVAVPMVGSLSLTLPSAFRDVLAPGAVVVGDGRGGTVVSWSLLLFAPLGSETQEVTWTAQARDAVVPAASLQVVPVTPASFGSLGATEQAYSGAVDSTTELTGGAREIDANLRRLADGAGELLDGLVQLRAGAAELATGLDDLDSGASTIAKALAAADAGGRDLTSGLGRLSSGSRDLADGVGDLAAGAALVDQNTGILAAGAQELSAGAAQVLAGIQALAGGLQGEEGLPAALAGIAQLKAGIGAIGTADTLLDGLDQVGDGLVEVQAGVGTPSTPNTLRNGIARVGGGLSNPLCNPADPANPANPCGVTQLNASVSGLSGAMLTDLQAVIADLSGIVGGLDAADQAVVAGVLTTLGTNAVRAGTIQATAGGIDTVVTQLQLGLSDIDAGLVAIADAIGDPATADTLRNGVFRITAGVSNPLCDPTNPTDPANPCGLLEGLTALQSGLTSAAAEVSAGLGSTSTEGTLLWGADQVSDGSSELAAGAQQLRTEGTAALAAGAATASDGAEQVADGAAEAAAGGSKLSAGLGQLADGGSELAAGAAKAADGASQIADGQVDATDGGRQIADGSEQLVEEGTTVLADTVSDATISSSLQLEQVRAVAARGIAGEGLPYPTVDGAVASAVYQFDLAGVGVGAGTGLPLQLGIGLVTLVLALGLGLATRSRLRAAYVPEASPSDRGSALVG